MFRLWRGFSRQSTKSIVSKDLGGRFNGNGNYTFTGGQRHVLTVSTTRGTPSTSIDLKEALCEKIPLYHDLLRNFRQEHGTSVISRITVENLYQGLRGVSTLIRETSEIDRKYGIKYRGLSIPEVMTLLPRRGKSPSAEAVFWLLLTGDIPTEAQTASLIADWTSRRKKRKDWWSGPEGGIVGSALQSLPRDTTPLGKLSVALTIFDAGRHARDAARNDVPNHVRWEYTYEDGMELLATLPAIVGLVSKGQRSTYASGEGDWVEFLCDCIGDPALEGSKIRRKSMEDFLRLYVVLNADEDGGVPGAHVTEILGASQSDTNRALAAGVLAYADEPKSGTMLQYMEFQGKLRALLGPGTREESLKNFVATFLQGDRLVGYAKSEFCDPRYTVLLDYVKENLPDDFDAKFSQLITRILASMAKPVKGRNICPEQNAIAAPVFQFYGLKDMEFNQVFLCVSRALGSVASIIWTRAIDAPVERPRSKCTYSYLNSLRNVQKNTKRGKYTKQLPP